MLVEGEVELVFCGYFDVVGYGDRGHGEGEEEEGGSEKRGVVGGRI